LRIFLFAESLRESCPETIGRNSLKANDVQERQDKNKLIDLKKLKKNCCKFPAAETICII